MTKKHLFRKIRNQCRDCIYHKTVSTRYFDDRYICSNRSIQEFVMSAIKLSEDSEVVCPMFLEK